MPRNKQCILRNRSRAGFSLIELIIVIGVIGVLSAILLSQFSGATESARATECLTHIRNLATAVQNCAMADGYYPSAGDNEYIKLHGTDMRYHVHKGFITRYGYPDPYNGGDGAASHQSPEVIATYGDAGNFERRLFCVTNSAIWRHGAKKLDEFVCPSHAKSLKKLKGQKDAAWSYAMNSYFGYDWSRGASVTSGLHRKVKYGECKRPDRRLLFAELPWNEDTNPKGASLKFSDKPGDTRYDGVLQYANSGWSGDKEWIGLDHKSGRIAYAHVCFADGHTERLAFPLKKDGSSSISKQELINLTTWLCQADDVQQTDGKWERTHKTEDEDD